MDEENKAINRKENEELDLSSDELQDKINDFDNISGNNEWKVIEKAEQKGSNILKAIGMILAVVIILSGMAWSGMKLYDLTQSPSYNKPDGESNKVVTSNGNSTNEETSKEEIPEVNVDEQKIIDINEDIHHMANTIILAVDGKINGTKQITMESIDEALNMVQGVDEYLYTEIGKWKKGDFSNAVEVHNYVWKKLDGEIGKADGLDEAAIESVRTNLGL